MFPWQTMGVHFHTYMKLVVIITSLLGGLEPWNFMTFILGMTFHILGMSSSQLLLTHIFQRGRYTTNQFMLFG